MKYVIPAFHIKALLKAYGIVKETYFKYNRETMYPQIAALERELKETKFQLNTEKFKITEIKNKENKELEDLQNENATLLKKIKNLEDKLSQTVSDSIEVKKLRNLLFNLSASENVDMPEESTIDLSALNDVRGVIVGGHPNWQNKLKEKLFEWVFYAPGVSINANVITNADIVIFSVSYFDHATYYKVIDLLRNRDIPFDYVSNTNIEMSLRDIDKIFRSINR
jgi:Uncharacterized protein conserved in bacteria